MKIGLPLVMYWLMTSACLAQAVQSTKVTSSRSSPLAVRYLRLQATPNSATAVLLPGMYFSCGSRVRFPSNRTLLKLAMVWPFPRECPLRGRCCIAIRGRWPEGGGNCPPQSSRPGRGVRRGPSDCTEKTPNGQPTGGEFILFPRPRRRPPQREPRLPAAGLDPDRHRGLPHGHRAGRPAASDG